MRSVGGTAKDMQGGNLIEVSSIRDEVCAPCHALSVEKMFECKTGVMGMMRGTKPRVRIRRTRRCAAGCRSPEPKFMSPGVAS